MSISANVLRHHLAYSAWASRKLIDAATQLSPEQLRQDFQTADHSVLGTLVHVFAADRVWLARLSGGPIPAFVTDADYQMSVLQNDWPDLHRRWQDWATALTDESVGTIVTYKDRAGNSFSEPLWQPILHVVNHGTHHRGQVSGFLRALGHTPPPIDFLYFYREQAAHA